MLDEVKKIAAYFKNDKGISALRKKILLIVLIFAVLLMVNRFILINFADKGDYFLSITRTKIVFWGTISVYTAQINPTAADLAEIDVKSLGDVPAFNLPLYALIFYLPFIYIKSFDWSLALWLTVNQVLCYFIINILLKILDWKVKEIYQYLAALITLFVYFIAGNVMMTNLSIIQIFLIVYALYRIKNDDHLVAGILLGLVLFNPIRLFLPIAILFLLNINNKRGTVNTWLIISFILFSMLLVIFDMRWLLEMAKVLVLQPSVYPFISFREYIAGIFPAVNTSVMEIVPIFIYIWIVIEYLRTPKENYLQELWLVCLGLVLNPLLNMWDNSYSTIAYLVVFIYTLSLWYERTTQKFRIFASVFYFILMIAAPIVQMILNKSFLTIQSTYIYNLITTFVLLINLYWVRLWVVNPYFNVNKMDEI